MKKIFSLFAGLFLFAAFSPASAQLNKDSVAALLNSKQFIFIANSADPLRGSTRFLTGTYDMKVKNDSLVSYLPYFGRSYSAPVTLTESPLSFTSVDFDYSYSPRKKNGWNVAMNVKDQSGVSKYIMTVFNDGTADLIVTSNFRDQISFRGYIKAIKKMKGE